MPLQSQAADRPQPNRQCQQLATKAPLHVAQARRAEGNLKYELSETTDNMFRVDERWNSTRSMYR